jgi:hypothetical protein
MLTSVSLARAAPLIVSYFDNKITRTASALASGLGMHGFSRGILPPSNWRCCCARIVVALWYALIFIATLAFAAYMVPFPNG